MKISDRLKLIRDRFNLSQPAAAAKFNIVAGTWKQYERGPSEPGAGALRNLADGGVNIHWLLTGEGEMLLEDAKRLPPGLRIEIDKVLAEGGDPEASTRQDAATHKLCAEYQAAQSLLDTMVKEAAVTLPNKTAESFKTLLWLSDGEESDTVKAAIQEQAKLINSQAPVPNSPIDYKLLQELIESLETALDSKNLMLAPARKAAVIQLMYEYCKLEDDVSAPATVERFLKLVA